MPSSPTAQAVAGWDLRRWGAGPAEESDRRRKQEGGKNVTHVSGLKRYRCFRLLSVV